MGKTIGLVLSTAPVAKEPETKVPDSAVKKENAALKKENAELAAKLKEAETYAETADKTIEELTEENAALKAAATPGTPE